MVQPWVVFLVGFGTSLLIFAFGFAMGRLTTGGYERDTARSIAGL